jgi:hypothetical protein
MATDLSNFDKRWSDANFLFYYYCIYTNYVWSCKSVHELAMAFQCINIKMHTHTSIYKLYHELNFLINDLFLKKTSNSKKRYNSSIKF